MALFTSLFVKLIPLYLTIALGYGATKLYAADRETVSRLLFYFIVPFVFFAGAMQTPLALDVVFAPVVLILVSCSLCFLFHAIGRRLWQDSTAHLLALTAGDANTGYFGLPVALLLFDSAGVGVYITLMVGMTVYENTIGFFMLARGKHTAGEAVRKLLQLPPLYAFALGIVVHALGGQIPAFTFDFFTYMRGAYLILGTMLIGMGLARVSIRHLDWRFIGLAFFAKFICYPLIAVTLVALDSNVLHLFTDAVHRAFILIALMPLAVNTVILSTLLGTHPEKASSSVFLSTLFALVYVPLMAAWLVK